MSQTKAELVNGLSVNAALADAITVDSSGRVGIGDDSPDREFIVKKASSNATIKIEASNAHTSQLFFSDTDTENVARISVFHGSGSDQNQMIFGTAGSSRLAINSSGDIGVGTITPDGRFHIMGGNLSGAGSVTANTAGNLLVLESNQSNGMSFLNANDERATIFFGTTGTNGNQEASISYAHEAVSTAADRRAMIFKTGGGNEVMRLDGSGNLCYGEIAEPAAGSDGIRLETNGTFKQSCTGTGERNVFEFKNANGVIGKIVTQNSGTTFATSSDYRLKENVVAISDGITRLKQLKPSRFNFIVKKDSTVDGFLAHEVESVVPEAISGEKDAMKSLYYEEGDSLPDGKALGDFKEYSTTEIAPQGIDQSKLVPLLTAALQEEIAKREALETRVAVLEAA